jgi:hypothetical protein
MKLRAIFLAAFIFGHVAPLPIHAQEGEFVQDGVYIGGPPPGDEPLKVRIGFNLVNITDVDEKEENIDFEGAVFMRWKDHRLAHDPASVGSLNWVPGDYSRVPRKIYMGDFRVKEIYPGWRPHLVIPNGIGDRVITNVAIGIWPDGMVTYMETFGAKVEVPMRMRRFPFDKQSLDVFFHPFGYRRGEVLLVPDENLSHEWDQDTGIAQWIREGAAMHERASSMVRFNETVDTISEYVVTIQIKRRPRHVLVSLVLPLILLVSLTWVVFWMDEESISNRVNISFIGILSVVAYYFVILDSVPEISYLTLMDAFILATFFVLAAGVVVNVVVDKLNRANRKANADGLDRICRWAFPAGYASVTLLMVLLFLSLD